MGQSVSIYDLQKAYQNSLDHRTITLRTVEKVEDQEVELAKSEFELWKSLGQSSSSRPIIGPPASLPFSIPLTSDLPQSIDTPWSSITHTLEAALFSLAGESVKESTQVQILRYSSSGGNSALPNDPVSTLIDLPSSVTIQLPRSIFHVGEPIPIYATIPPPSDSSVSSGLRLRNVMAELVRVVQVGHVGLAASSSSTQPPQPSTSASRYPPEKSSGVSGSQVHHSVVSRSGAACRFHSERPLQIRLVLHDPEGPTNALGTITQSTLIHHVAFHVDVVVSFTTPNHVSSVAKASFPVTIIPPVAPNQSGDYSQDLDQAYQKKHDPPPIRTNRTQDDVSSHTHGAPPAFDEVSTSRTVNHPMPYPSAPPPAFSPSGGGGHAPPPTFDESEASSSNPARQLHSVLPSFEESSRAYAGVAGTGLPTFAESMTASSSSHPLPLVPGDHSPLPFDLAGQFSYWAQDPLTGQRILHFRGEGEEYGFTYVDQYDGISQSMMQTVGPSTALSDSTSPLTGMPPAQYQDRDLDSIGILVGPPPGIDESLAAGVAAAFASGDISDYSPRVSEGAGEADDVPPPPPPALDDPSDPPPTIDAYGGSLQQTVRRTNGTRENGHLSNGAGGTPIGSLEGLENPNHQEPPPYLGASIQTHHPAVRNVLNNPHASSTGGPPPYAG